MQTMYTGERILPGSVFNVTYYQSLAAYQFITQLSAGKAVLDVACGEGYGTAMLGKVAAKSVGIDQDKDSIVAAQLKYAAPNISFKLGSLFSLPAMPEGPFDIVCCLQTIEHVHDHDAFLKALQAQTNPGGIIVVSTPNKRQFPTFNPYHVHELDLAETTALFARRFKKFEIFGVFGDQAVLNYRMSKQRIGYSVLALDFLHLRAWLPGWLLQPVYQFLSRHVIKQFSFWRHRDTVENITEKNFTIRSTDLAAALDFIVVAQT